jgi:hypothetical protein
MKPTKARGSRSAKVAILATDGFEQVELAGIPRFNSPILKAFGGRKAGRR